MTTETDQPDVAVTAEEVEEVYDHTVPKPKRAGLALLASWFFFGGGQLVKGHYRRFFALWGILVGLLGLFLLNTAIWEPGSTVLSVTSISSVVGIGVLWVYQLWDAVTRP
jgi:hypothetical protein